MPAALRAQPAPPPGGYRLRAVRVLRPVPESAGGLVPYRKGKLWGYADTLGRLVVAPQLANQATTGNVFLVNGFAQIGNVIPDKFTRRLYHPRLNVKPRYQAVFINARGELLCIKPSEAAVLQPDGSLVRRPRREVVGQPELRRLPQYTFNSQEYTGMGEYMAAPVPPYQPTPNDYYYRFFRRRPRRYDEGHLAPNRMALSNQLLHGSPRFRSDDTEKPPRSRRQQRRENHPLSLATVKGRRLTRFRFAGLGTFGSGLAPASVRHYRGHTPPPTDPTRWGYIGPGGGWRIRPRFTDASAFRGGVAVVEVGDEYGIIDSLGQYRLAPQPHQLDYEPDAAGFVRLWATDGPGRSVRLLAPPSQPGFLDSLNTYAGQSYQNRIWVQRGARQGLLNLRGAWVTPQAYELLFAPSSLRFSLRQVPAEGLRNWWCNYCAANDWRQLDNLELARRYRNRDEPKTLPWLHPDYPHYPTPDTAYLVARRAGRYGFVARHSGREVVPCRYDSVLVPLFGGLGCVARGGTAYVVDAQGRELAAARYRGVDFLTPQGRLLHLTRTAPDTAWALLDAQGRLRTPWVPGTGYPTPEGWLLSRQGGHWTLRDSTGRVALASERRIRHADLDAPWRKSQGPPPRTGYDWDPGAPYWGLHFPPRQPAGRTAFLVDEADGGMRLLDATLREIGRCPYRPDSDTYPAAGVLGRGWFRLVPPSEARRSPARIHYLLTDTGRLLQSTPDYDWDASGRFYYSEAFYHRGVLPTSKGYLTRGGRRLWAD